MTIQFTSWLTELNTILNKEQISTSDSVREQHAKGESYDGAIMPDVVLYPETTRQVSAIMQLASKHHIPVTPVAANSSLEGHTVPVRGGISLDLTRMNRIVSFSAEDLLIVVQPGVTYPQINEYVKRSGLFFPVDPGAHASLGGMISTNASGTAAVRYGVTGDYVLALEVVMPDGQIIRTGSKARKSSSGYNLKRLFCGAEGTLGVITEATIRLTGLPEAASAARVPFVNTQVATEFVTSLIQAGVPVARCELIDAQSVRAVNAHQGTQYPEEVTVFLEFHGNPAGVEADALFAQQLAEDAGALAFEASSDPQARAQLWEARHALYYAEVAANPGMHSVVTDVAVPISQLPVIVQSALQKYEDAGYNAYLVGHVGDGNFHLTIFYDPADTGARDAIEAIAHDMVRQALQVGGTSTGEHGVGLRKLKYMQEEHGASLELMRVIKDAFDPSGIMNPGKKLPA